MTDSTEIQPVTHSALELVDDYLNGDLVLDDTSAKALNAPSVSDRRAEVDLPEPVHTEDILGHDVTWIAWRAQEALLVSEGTLTDGFLCVGFDHTAHRKIVLFVGGIALTREFRRLKAPVRARIEKRGRTLVLR